MAPINERTGDKKPKNSSKKSGVKKGYHIDPETGVAVPNTGEKGGNQEGDRRVVLDQYATDDGGGGGSDTTSGAPQGYGSNARGAGKFRPGRRLMKGDAEAKAIFKQLKGEDFWQNLNANQQQALFRYFNNNAGGGGYDATMTELLNSGNSPGAIYQLANTHDLDFGKLLSDLQPKIAPGVIGTYFNTEGNTPPTLQNYQQNSEYMTDLLNYVGPNGLHWSVLEQMFPGQDFGGPPGNQSNPNLSVYGAPEGFDFSDYAGLYNPYNPTDTINTNSATTSGAGTGGGGYGGGGGGNNNPYGGGGSGGRAFNGNYNTYSGPIPQSTGGDTVPPPNWWQQPSPGATPTPRVPPTGAGALPRPHPIPFRPPPDVPMQGPSGSGMNGLLSDRRFGMPGQQVTQTPPMFNRNRGPRRTRMGAGGRYPWQR